MEDGNTPVGGPLVSVEVSSRSEGVPPSRKRGSEEGGIPKDAMLKHAVCISEMTVILMSLGVTTANFKVAELFCRNRFGDSGVDIDSSAAEVVCDGAGPSVAARVAAAQEGPDEAMRQALAASSAREALVASSAEKVLAASSTMAASAASDADMVDKNQIGGEKPVLLIGSPMCQTSCGVITTMMRDANRVSEVKYKNFVEQCVRHLPGNAGRLFLHENLWDWWSRGLSFVKKMAESDGMHQTKSELCGSQSTKFSEDRILFQVEIQSTSLRSWACVAATKGSGPRFM